MFRNIIYLAMTRFALVMRILLAKPQLGKKFKYLVTTPKSMQYRNPSVSQRLSKLFRLHLSSY